MNVVRMWMVLLLLLLLGRRQQRENVHCFCVGGQAQMARVLRECQRVDLGIASDTPGELVQSLSAWDGEHANHSALQRR